MPERVVVTGMGVLAANAHGLDAFEQALREGRSGIRFHQKLRDLGFGCQVGGVPEVGEELKRQYFAEDALRAMNSSMIYAGIAAIDCWRDAGFAVPEPGGDAVDWDTGAIVGTGIGGVDTVGDYVVPRVNEGKVRRLGSATVEQTMASSVSACIGGLLALGGQVTTNSSACTTGTEAIVDAMHKIREGRATRVLAGGAEGSSHYIWAGFDAMRVLARQSNDCPEAASRPMSASAGGFVPSSGAGLLMLESLSSALARGARIHAEVLGGHVNCGGQRGGGSMTAPNPDGATRCIHAALALAGIGPDAVDAINGHLTATMADTLEVATWQRALGRAPSAFPLIHSTKSLVGHGLGAAGGIESVAAVLELSRRFVHGSINCEDLHPDLAPFAASIPHATIEASPRVIAKASFGFGDVNGCLLFRRWDG
ncbi:MAG TPA: beta-ketoacyl-[acyl-carrier-protein] synthase family protein [Vicinamibacterales bacterium]|nr:beta-ketoacyl-[acyl-carrier-protein] synthase family protein [Vicinamibacterales bacterium]